MIGRCEDKISKLPDSIVCHILSRLPTKNVIQTSVLSKDWEHKWTSINNFQIVEETIYLQRHVCNVALVAILDKILHPTQNSGIKSFRLTSFTSLPNLTAWMNAVLARRVQNLEINTPLCGAGTFYYNDIHSWRSLKELKLSLDCTLVVSVLRACCPNLEVLHLGRTVKLLNDDAIFNNHTSKLLLSFPVLKELKLICCKWQGATSIEFNASALTKFVAEGSRGNDCLIKIDGPKLEKFQSHGDLVENVVFTNAPLIFYAEIINRRGGAKSGFRAHAILRSLSTVVQLNLSSEIVKALIEAKTEFPLRCFTQLKHLTISANISDEALVKLLRVMPSVEVLHLDVWDLGLLSFPSSIASRLKRITVVGFKGTTRQIHFAMSVLKNAENLEILDVSVCDRALERKTEIMDLLSSLPKRSSNALVRVLP